jgi:hypothetical protein
MSAAPPASSAERFATRAERALDIVRVLAREPRPAGSAAEARARQYCAERLRRAGFEVSEEPFEYSSFVGRWGTPVGGIVALAVLLVATAAGRSGRDGAALASLTLGAVLLGLAARALARSGVLVFPAERRRGMNLVARRRHIEGEPPPSTADGAPSIWLMAHLDSKSQPVPILARAAGITLLGAVWMAGLLVAAAGLATGAAGATTLWTALGVLAIVGAVPVIATTVGSRSPGALDNASGVATILVAAEDAGASDVGICLTSGEELGLAGARAWTRGGTGARPSIAINCDGVDDVGRSTCMYSGRRPDALVASVLAAASRSGVVLRAHRLLPGVLTDGVALADAGWNVVTLSRGSARTLARLHTARDRADTLTGDGMDEVAGVIVALLEART